jgi:hypothetical protein
MVKQTGGWGAMIYALLWTGTVFHKLERMKVHEKDEIPSYPAVCDN